MADPNDPLTQIASDVAVNIITKLFEESLHGLESFGRWIKGKTKESDPLGTAARNYANRMEERYNFIKIFSTSKPIPLRNIYVRLNILKKITARQRVSVKELEKNYPHDWRGFGRKLETKEGIDVVNKERKLIILGKPGAGKTTFLRYIALRALDGELTDKCIPVFISLKNWSDSDLTLLDYIVQQFDICGFPEAQPYIERILEKGKCLLLLDGFDEVTEKVNEAVTTIRNFSDKYSLNRLILSCRIAAWNYFFDKFTDVEMADFDDKQIKIFIKNWFGKGTKKAKLCWETLNANPPIKELASNPLLLTMLCLTFDETMEFPRNRADLYEEALRALLTKWNAARGTKYKDVYGNLSSPRKVTMLSRIAAETFEKDQYFIPQRTLEKQISDYIKNLPEAQANKVDVDSEAVLKAIEAQHGLLVERANRIYSFSHLTFQEYFTAKYIVDNAQWKSLERLIENHLLEDKWREVFLLTTGILSKADEFLIEIRKKISSFAEYKLTTFVNNIKFCIKEDFPFPLSICKVLIIYLLDRDRAHDRDRALAIDLDLALALDLALDLAHDLARDPDFDRDRALDLSRVLALDLDRDSARAFARAPDLALARARALDLAIDLDFDRARDLDLALDKEHRSLLLDYLYATNRLVECLNTDCYVTKPTRQLLLDSVLEESWEAPKAVE